jgi:hypothetical protein
LEPDFLTGTCRRSTTQKFGFAQAISRLLALESDNRTDGMGDGHQQLIAAVA